MHDEDGDGVVDASTTARAYRTRPSTTATATASAMRAIRRDERDRIAWFDSFAEAGAANAWRIQSGAWMFDGESLI